jgi:uncharacterized protein YecE (DUF72 family)
MYRRHLAGFQVPARSAVQSGRQDAGGTNMPKIWIGTSGFSYPEWKGSFYPEDLPAKKYLSYYATHFHTTEINNSFYRTPNEKNVTAWYNEVPYDFSFTLKLNQKITHVRRLNNVAEEMDHFLKIASFLKEKLGTILVQTPPYFRKDMTVLENFVSTYGSQARLAFEFRHESWFDEQVYSTLRNHNCAWGVVEAEDRDAIREVTANFIYMRLRKGDYSPEELQVWGEWIKSQTVEVYCYLKHDEAAPVLAKQLMKTIFDVAGD